MDILIVEKVHGIANTYNAGPAYFMESQTSNKTGEQGYHSAAELQYQETVLIVN